MSDSPAGSPPAPTATDGMDFDVSDRMEEDAMNSEETVAPRRSTRDRRPPANFFNETDAMLDVWGAFELYPDLEIDATALVEEDVLSSATAANTALLSTLDSSSSFRGSEKVSRSPSSPKKRRGAPKKASSTTGGNIHKINTTSSPTSSYVAVSSSATVSSAASAPKPQLTPFEQHLVHLRESVESAQSAAISDLSDVRPSNPHPAPAGFYSDELGYVSASHELMLMQRIEMKAPVQCVELHPSGQLLAVATILADIHLFRWTDLKWENVCALPTAMSEAYVDEIHTMSFSPDGNLLFAAGSRKCRHSFDSRDKDLKVLPSPLIVFNLSAVDASTGLVQRVEWAGHSEETLKIACSSYQGTNHVLTCGQDGYVMKWTLGAVEGAAANQSQPWLPSLAQPPKRFSDNTTWIAFDIAFLPCTGNRYFLLAGDDGVKLLDFQSETVIASWPRLYSASCDSLRIFHAQSPLDSGWYFVSHGTESTDESATEDGGESISSSPAELHLRLLLPPTVNSGTPFTVNHGWALRSVSTFSHELQQANAWPLRFAATSSLVFVPTVVGKVFVWDIKSNSLVAVLADHMQARGGPFRGGGGGTIRQILAHPHKPCLITAAEDGDVCFYLGSSDRQPGSGFRFVCFPYSFV
jgi:hypothetical protein